MKSSTKVPYDSTRDALKQRQKDNVRSEEPKIRTVDRERTAGLLHSKSLLGCYNLKRVRQIMKLLEYPVMNFKRLPTGHCTGQT